MRIEIDWDRFFMGAFGLLMWGGLVWQIIALALKLCGTLSWSWWWIMAPALGVAGLLALLAMVIGFCIMFSMR